MLDHRWLMSLGVLLAAAPGCLGLDGKLLDSTRSEVTGIVVSDRTGDPVAGAEVRVGSATATTDAAGYFVLTDLTPGTQTIAFEALGYERFVLELRLEPGANALGTIHLPPLCDLGFGDCNGTMTDGCEESLDSSHENCGSCGNACPADLTCASGQCVPVVCEAGTGDCNDLAADGCEADLERDAANCGACGQPCAEGQACYAARCLSIVAQIAAGATLIGADDAHVYWTYEPTQDALGNVNADGTIARAPVGGGTAEALVSTSRSSLLGARMNATGVYWADTSGNGAIRSASKADGSVQVLVTPMPAGSMFIEVDDESVYLFQRELSSSPIPFTLLEASATASSVPTTLASFELSDMYVWYHAQDATTLYLTTTTQGRLISKADGSITLDARFPSTVLVRSTVVGSEGAYFYMDVYGDPVGGKILFVPADLAEPSTILAAWTGQTETSEVMALTSDSIVWIQSTDAGFALQRLSRADHAQSTLLSSAVQPVFVANGGDVFLLDEGRPEAGQALVVRYTLPAL